MRKVAAGRIVGGLLATVMLSTGAFSSCEAEGRSNELAEARQRWADAQIDDYTWTIELVCFCVSLPGPVEVTVRDGIPVATSVAVANNYPLTVEDLFDIIEADIKADDLQVLYQREFGYPVTVAIDPISEIADEETTYILSNFAAG